MLYRRKKDGKPIPNDQTVPTVFDSHDHEVRSAHLFCALTSADSPAATCVRQWAANPARSPCIDPSCQVPIVKCSAPKCKFFPSIISGKAALGQEFSSLLDSHHHKVKFRFVCRVCVCGVCLYV